MELINVMAASLDGHIALYPKESDEQRSQYGFSIPADKEFVRTQIQGADAIITGAESMRASSGTWQEMNKSSGVYPYWVVLTRRGLEEDLLFWQQNHIPRAVVSPAPLAANKMFDPKVENWSPTSGKNIAVFTFQKLKAMGFKRVLLFGGGAINALFYEAQLVDELNVTICPFLLATKQAPNLIDPTLAQFVKLELLSSQAVESHVFLRYRVKK